MKVIDVILTRRADAWWLDYLAYLASTPRNWVERKLEPLTQTPGSRIHVVDVSTPEEEGVADGYPTAGLTLWWTILCLDGAPERMRHQIEACGQSRNVAHDMLAPAEDQFRSLIATAMDELPVKPAAQVLGNWRDGAILGYETRESAIDIVVAVGDACAQLNAALRLPWTWQFHSRASIGPSLRTAFSGLLRAHRDQLSCVIASTAGPHGAELMKLGLAPA
ncbi:MAG: hypothetical protein WEA04_02440 [Candidatus Andersenbacteria bacterium]